MNDYRFWTEAEAKECRDRYASGVSAKQIALDLGRSVNSIYGRLYRGNDLAPFHPSQQNRIIHFLLKAPATKAEILAQGFTFSPVKKLVTLGHVVGRTCGQGSIRTYEVTNEGKRNLDSRYPNPCGPPANGPR